MSKQVTKRKVGRYSNEIRQQAGLEYAICGSLATVNRSMDISMATLSTWNSNGVWDELIEQVRTEKASEHRAQYSKIIDTAQAKALELIPNMTDAKAAVIIAATATDKVRLADNMPTSIRGDSKTMQSMIERFEKIEQDHQQIQGSVVSVQPKDNQ